MSDENELEDRIYRLEFRLDQIESEDDDESQHEARISSLEFYVDLLRSRIDRILDGLRKERESGMKVSGFLDAYPKPDTTNKKTGDQK